MIRKFTSVALFAIFLSLCVNAQTKLIIIGTVHTKTRNVSADSIFAVLEKVNPDLILLEFDSSFFDKHFRIKDNTISNETLGASKYAAIHKTPLRPFDLEGRNNYYLRPGILQRQSGVYQKLITIRKNLDAHSKKIVADYLWLTGMMEQAATKTLAEINSPDTDTYAAMQESLMDHELRQIVTTNKTMASVKKTFIEECNFWNKRNRAMVINISTHCDLNQGKKIVVLTGFYHKHFLVEALASKYLIQHY